ncbi:LysR family transcriptional regulator [Acinetobacter bereziniae]|uniref:HTH lysR-type domain-containing protein n=1 Tax=Acinetobacter bereziniae NIPH 3 TaxID=1217651 RepID=N8X8G5_ACIBZ|nr:LysR substrate-binding domain-containing protein [Acinetobacter bereziniae]ENV20717.1 hypothetical protein F963_03299 [Acinetobacter bereziniae NIPH 3]
MFDTILLRSLIAVTDTGGFTRAAEELHLTQSAISAHIRRLETEAGHKLLKRTTRSVSLTPAGIQLAGYARTILALHDDARMSLGASKLISGTISVGLSEEMAQSAVIDCLRQFTLAHPDIELALRIGLTGEMLPLLQSGSLDIILGSRCGGDKDSEVLWTEPMVWVSGPVPFAIDDLSAPLPLVVFPDQCPYRAAAIESLVRSGHKWRISCQTPSIGALVGAVNGGLGIAPIRRSIAVSTELQEIVTLPSLPQAEFILTINEKPKHSATLLMTELRKCISRNQIL